MKKLALIGTGGIARAHVEAIRHEQARANLVAAVDIRRDAVESFCQTYAIPKAYTDIGAMLKLEQPDLVHICTPPQSHAELSVQCMQAGAWVLCEKPLVMSLAELDNVEKAEEETGSYTSSVYQWRFGAGAQHLKTLIDKGEVGRALYASAQTVWYRNDAYYAVPWRGTWESESGGASMIHGIHALDLLLWLYGPWQDVTAKIGILNHDIEVEDLAVAIIRFESGALATLANSVVSPRQESYLRFDFEKVTVELKHLYRFTNNDWTYSLYEDSSEQEALKTWQALPEDAPSLHTGQLSHMLDCLETNTRPLTSGYGARMTVEFLASMYKSALTGEPVKRGSVTPSDPFYKQMNGGLSL